METVINEAYQDNFGTAYETYKQLLILRAPPSQGPPWYKLVCP